MVNFFFFFNHCEYEIISGEIGVVCYWNKFYIIKYSLYYYCNHKYMFVIFKVDITGQ